jgi:hypothetical protein
LIKIEGKVSLVYKLPASHAGFARKNMKRIMLALFCSLFLVNGVEGGETWTEKLTKRLAEILNPINSAPTPVQRPVTLPEPSALKDPWVSPPLFQGLPPKPWVEAIKPIRPRMTQEPAPLVSYRAQPEAPQLIVLPTTLLVALPARDVNEPIPVPILSTPLSDRASLADATLEASISAALAQAIPLRDQTVAFAPMNLPDPFELRETVKLTNPPPESDVPMANPPRILLNPVPAKK